METQRDRLKKFLESGDRNDLHPRKKDLPGRNDPCYCGSGKKYKKCCLIKQGGKQ